MDKKNKISNIADLELRIGTLQEENDALIDQIKSGLTSVSTYLPTNYFTEGLSLNSLNDVAEQFNKKGFTLSLLIPYLLNNTVLRNKSAELKTFVASLFLLIGNHMNLEDVQKGIKKLFSHKKKKKKKKKTILSKVANEETSQVISHSEGEETEN